MRHPPAFNGRVSDGAAQTLGPDRLIGTARLLQDKESVGVELVETHISYLFFAGRHIYKVKKPVNYGFLRWIQSPGNLTRVEV